jgi:hypothetical protein
MYVALLGLIALRRLRPDTTVYVTAAAFALTLAGVIFAGYLTYVELFVLEAICQWCVVSAVLTTLLLVTEGMMIGAAPGNPGRWGSVRRVSSTSAESPTGLSVCTTDEESLHMSTAVACL